MNEIVNIVKDKAKKLYRKAKRLLRGLNTKKVLTIIMIAWCLYLLGSCAFSGSNKWNIGKRLDLTNDFSESEISAWKKENKEKRNKYLLNGGYYIHFDGVNYPVVFTEGKITRFDNMPEEIAFIDMSSLYTDAKCKNMCSYIGRYTIHYSFFAPSDEWRGYLIYGKRPKNGTVLYLDESNERTFVVEHSETRLSPDDTIVLNDRMFAVCYDNVPIIITDEHGALPDECNTIRKLYHWAMNQGFPFKRTEYSYVPYLPFMNFSDYEYWHDNDWLGGTTFDEKELREAKEDEDYYSWIECSYTSIFYILQFNVKYDYSGAENKNYAVIIDPSAEADFDTTVGTRSYSDDSDGKITSYSYNGEKINVFRGTLDEFTEFLLTDSVINESDQTAISGFRSGTASDFRKEYGNTYNGGVILCKYSSISGIIALCGDIHAVWDKYDVLTLHGEEDIKINVCKNKEYVLPTPQKAGYEFKGWYANSDFSGGRIEKVSMEDGYSELYAKYEPVDHYTLSFEPFEGKTFDDIVYSYGEEIQLPTLIKTFYIFNGWCIDSECKSEPMKEISSEFFGSYKLYPSFTPREYTVLLMDGSSVNETKLKYGEDYTLPIGESAGEFLGYFDAFGTQYTDENGVSLAPFTDAADIQLFAKYKKEDK